jgi:TFIIF-interacting CTD phosphatase-like protein
MKRGLVLLDLDHTIISAVEMNKLKRVKNPEAFQYKDFAQTYRIYERPYLQLFLDKLFSRYRVAVWTAAGISYANFIIKNFILTKPERKLEFVMWSEHCEVSEERHDHQKKLKMLDFLNEPMVILDDNQEVLETQQNKSVDSRDFDVENENGQDDDFLLHAIEEIEKKLKKQKK